MKLHAAGPAPVFEKATLVVPAITVGNVGQLAVDLLIATLRAPRVGVLDDACALPCAGVDAFSHAPGLALAEELFQLPGSAVYVLQQRAPAAPGRQLRHAEALAAWAKGDGFAQVWVLGSLDASVRRDAQLSGSQLRCWAEGGALPEACAAAGLAPLEADYFLDKALEARPLPPWPLLRACRALGLPAAAVLVFAAEGDNVAHAVQLADAACGAVPGVAAAVDGGGGGAREWTRPDSWQQLFGARREAVY